MGSSSLDRTLEIPFTDRKTEVQRGQWTHARTLGATKAPFCGLLVQEERHLVYSAGNRTENLLVPKPGST